jgi:hypothetical protein
VLDLKVYPLDHLDLAIGLVQVVEAQSSHEDLLFRPGA